MKRENCLPVGRVPMGLLAAFAIAALALAAPSPAARAATPDSSAAARPDSTLLDTTRVVRTLPPTLVRASRLDVLSSEARRRVTATELRSLPIDRVADALALQPGVVVDGEIVYVRGARPGELRVEMDGIALNEPLRGESIELPLVALEDLDLIRGGLEAEHGGGLAGTLVARPAVARERWRSRVLWQTDAGRATHDDRVGAMAAGPIPGTGLGIAVGGEARLDDTQEPALRTTQRTKVGPLSFGWRAKNQTAMLARIAPVENPARVAIQALVSRKLLRPFNPMFSLVGFTSPCTDPMCINGPVYSPVGGPNFTPYNAADHYPVTDVQRTALIASSQWLAKSDRARLSLGWNRERRLTSIDGRDDESYLDPSHELTWGYVENPLSDPFHVYSGDTPYFKKTRSEWWEARADWKHEWKSGSSIGAGGGATHQQVRWRELDFAFRPSPFDSFRVFTASAPGAYGWVSGRWVNGGMIANLGLRATWYSPGPDADQTLHTDPVGSTLSLDPRFGVSYPLSTTDALQLSYARLTQDPGREFLYDSRTARIVPVHPLGNPALEPSTAISYEMMLKHLTGEQWSTQAGFFYRDLYRQVSARSTVIYGPNISPSGERVLQYASDDAGHALGLEVVMERDDPGRSHLTATYTWMQTMGSESFEDGLPFYPLRLAQPPPIAEHPLAWDQPHRLTLQVIGMRAWLSGSWSTLIASGLPWTPAETRKATADLSGVHSRRLPMFTITDLSFKARHPRLRPVALGLEIRNLFDARGQRRVSIDGYPNPVINTQYDDYAAHRTQTSTGGAAFWNDLNGDGVPGWVGVYDPRLDFTRRVIRLSLEAEW